MRRVLELRRILAGDETQTADELETLLREAMQGRRRWMQARSDPSHDHADQRPEMPSLRDSFARMFGLGKDQRDIIRAAKDASTAKKL